ncbi:hypothetical protein ACSVH5_12225 [Flavobacterium sp. RSSA_27]|uniref:hypothetical protein n=1 Tax=Flavobacterium sp. RSSA_27 TaxID=3447667 RepID=UPI003F3E43C5
MRIGYHHFIFFLLFFCASCQVTETIHFNEDGSGTISVEMLRIEQSYQQLAGEEYNKNEVFEDTTYVFDDYISKYSATFSRLTPEDKAVFNAYKGVKVHIKKNSFEKEFRTIFTQNFLQANQIADLYKTQEYVSDLVHNYALSAEEHYYKIAFVFTENEFKRIVSVKDEQEFKKKREKIVAIKSGLPQKNLYQKITLHYHFTKMIKSVSNPNAKVSPDKKSVEITFGLLESLFDPISTSVVIVFEE